MNSHQGSVYSNQGRHFSGRDTLRKLVNVDGTKHTLDHDTLDLKGKKFEILKQRGKTEEKSENAEFKDTLVIVYRNGILFTGEPTSFFSKTKEWKQLLFAKMKSMKLPLGDALHIEMEKGWYNFKKPSDYNDAKWQQFICAVYENVKLSANLLNPNTGHGIVDANRLKDFKRYSALHAKLLKAFIKDEYSEYDYNCFKQNADNDKKLLAALNAFASAQNDNQNALGTLVATLTEVIPSKQYGGRRKTKRSKRSTRLTRNKKCKRRTRRS